MKEEIPFDYQAALAFIHGAYGKGRKNGLENMRALLARLENPQNDFPAIHVAGTNGKGSVCAFLYAALHCAGLRVGLYTSPFLQRYNERMRVDGLPIPDADLAAITGDVAREVEHLHREDVLPTEFEIGTAVAFLYFARAKVDIAVIEVGLGGRLDPTNVIRPRACAIAAIGLDHTKVLGDTLPQIARQKAGIAKRGVPLVLSAQADDAVRRAVMDACAAAGAPFLLAKEGTPYPLGMAGAHQQQNAAVALEALYMLKAQGFVIPEAAMAQGFARARWPGRLEWVMEAPPLLLDGAHNPQGARALAAYVRTLPKRRTVLLCGILQGKDWRGIVGALSGIADAAVALSPESHRALPAGTLRDGFARENVPAEEAESLEAGLEKARALAGPGGRVVAAGSLYLVGALRTLALGQDDALLLPRA